MKIHEALKQGMSKIRLSGWPREKFATVEDGVFTVGDSSVDLAKSPNLTDRDDWEEWTEPKPEDESKSEEE